MHTGYTANGKTLFFTQHSPVGEDIRSFWDDFASDSPTLTGYTSGSTGAPKALSIQKSAMLYSAAQTVRFFGLDASSTALLCLPVKYIAGRMMLVRAYVAGMRVQVAQPALNPLMGLHDVALDFAAFTPAQVWEIMKDEASRRIFSRIRYVIIGGAAVDAELEKRLLPFPNTVYATYGMTETVSHIALRKLGEKAYTKISPHTVLETDADNCLRIFDARLTPEPLQTNDVVQLLDESRFVWLGRRDFVINSGGVKLQPEQLEEKIRTLPGWDTRNFFIAAEKHAQYGERPVLVLEGDAAADVGAFSSILTRIELPDKIFRVPHFVWTESGKLNRRETWASIKQ